MSIYIYIPLKKMVTRDPDMVGQIQLVSIVGYIIHVYIYNIYYYNIYIYDILYIYITYIIIYIYVYTHNIFHPISLFFF